MNHLSIKMMREVAIKHGTNQDQDLRWNEVNAGSVIILAQHADRLMSIMNDMRNGNIESYYRLVKEDKEEVDGP